MAIKISIQMCSYNRKDILKKSLEAVFKVDFAPSDYEIVLVDDGSTDGTGEMIKSLNPPCRIKYMPQEHAGLSKGRNLGIRSAEGEVVLFIDDDIIADRNLLKEHWAFHEQDAKCVVMGWVNHVDDLEKIQAPKFTHADISTSFFWTSNVSVRRKYLMEAGLFDEDFTEYGWEDIEFGHRLKRLGLTRKYNPKALVYHFKKKWRASDLPRLCKQAQSSGRSAVIYVSKRPCLSARMSTGMFPLRFVMNDLMKPMAGICARIIKMAGDAPLSGLPLFCARTLVSFDYFDSARASLASKKAH